MRYFCFIVLFIIPSISIAACDTSSYTPVKRFVLAQNGMFPSFKKGKSIIAATGFAFSSMSLQRGDVALFCSGHKESKDEFVFIWRVIGLPGDKIKIDRNRVLLNGDLVLQKKVREDSEVVIYEESIGDITYQIAVSKKAKEPYQAEFIVPDDHIFLLGDNRDASYDSRYMGYIPIDKVFGIKVL